MGYKNILLTENKFTLLFFKMKHKSGAISKLFSIFMIPFIAITYNYDICLNEPSTCSLTCSGEVCSIQHYVIQIVSDFWQVRNFVESGANHQYPNLVVSHCLVNTLFSTLEHNQHLSFKSLLNVVVRECRDICHKRLISKDFILVGPVLLIF